MSFEVLQFDSKPCIGQTELDDFDFRAGQPVQLRYLERGSPRHLKLNVLAVCTRALPEQGGETQKFTSSTQMLLMMGAATLSKLAAKGISAYVVVRPVVGTSALQDKVYLLELCAGSPPKVVTS